MGKAYEHLLDSRTIKSQASPLAGGSLVFDLPFDPSYRHTFAGIEYYSDAGITPVVPSAGTESYLLTTTTKPTAKQIFAGNVINSLDEAQVSWSANVNSVECTLAGVVGATYARLILTGNIS